MVWADGYTSKSEVVAVSLIDYEAYFDVISQLFDCSATVYGVTDDEAFDGASPNISDRGPNLAVPLYVDVPCYVEFENSDVLVGNMPTATQRITLICADSYEIPEGATIDVLKHGAQRRFRAAGVADHLGTHQEIALEAVDYAEGD